MKHFLMYDIGPSSFPPDVLTSSRSLEHIPARPSHDKRALHGNIGKRARVYRAHRVST